MKLEPVLTEKAYGQAQEGKYTFWVPKSATKSRIKNVVESVFGVHVKDIKTLGGKKKKAIVRLGEKEKIAAFEVKEQK